MKNGDTIVGNYEAAQEALSYEPDPLPFDREIIAQSVYESLCEGVECGEISLDEANILYNNWREDYM